MDKKVEHIINSFPPDYKRSSDCFGFDKSVIDYLDNTKINNNSVNGKLIIVGDSGVGKTCILNRFHKNVFTENYKLTIGVDFDTQNFRILGHEFRLHCWDTAGEERFRAITKTYYRNAHVALIVFDFSSITTLGSIKKWANEVLNYAINKNQITGQIDEPLLFVVGTKKDLICQSTFEYIEQEAMKIAKELKAHFWAVSSQTGENIDKLFRSVGAFTFSEIILREIEAHEHQAALEIKKVYANQFIRTQPSFRLKKNNKEKFKGLKLIKSKLKCFRL